VSTRGSSFDTLLGLYTGTSVSALTRIDYNDDEDYSGGISTSLIYCDVAGGQTYHIAVDGYAGAVGSVSLRVQVQPFPVAPAWARPDPFGQPVNSAAFAGKVIILDFWATWCGPCKVEIPDYVYLQQKYGPDGLAIIGPSVDDMVSDVRTFMATNSPPINYQLVMADYAMEQAYGGIDAIPTTFVIDRQNKIRKKYVGTRSRATFERAVIPLLYGNTCLNCRPSGNQLELCWRKGAVAFTLESSTSMTGGAWSAWPTQPTVANGTNYVTVPGTGAPRFFRLRMSY
jgi:thiol-disulfide isomerase/thioredoxin